MNMAGVLKQDVDAYDRHYVVDNRLTMEWYPQRVVAMSQPGSMLELGVGHGYSTRYFSRAFERYTVLEGSEEMIERFRARHDSSEVDIVQGFFEDFDTDLRFDAIGMGFVLEHVDDPVLILRNFSCFLNPGGAIFIAVPNAEALHRRIGFEAGLLHDLHALSERDIELGHQRYFSCGSLRQTVEEAGLVVQHLEGLLLKPITTDQINQLGLSEDILQALLKVGVDYPELSNSILIKAGLPPDAPHDAA
jgi:SAM-dependent methyltransferase